jgi:hypothetical protein
MILKNDGDVRTIFYIFAQYMTKGPVELDAKLVRSVQAKYNFLLNLIFLLNHKTQQLHKFKHYIQHFHFRPNNDINITLLEKNLVKIFNRKQS